MNPGLDVFNAAWDRLPFTPTGKVLWIGLSSPDALRPYLLQGFDAFALGTDRELITAGNDLTPDRWIETAEDEPFQSVVHLGAPDDLRQLHRASSRFAFIVWDDGQPREIAEQVCFEAGFRRLPLMQSLVSFQELETEHAPLLIALEKIPGTAAEAYPLDKLVEERMLHTDMLRESGRRSDAHLARYQWATDYIRPHDVVLDVACGLGYGSAILWDGSECEQVTGIDNSEFAIEYANANYRPHREGLAFTLGDARDLSAIADNSVDCFVSFETLEHLPDPEVMVKEVARVLKPGGRFLGSVPNMWIDETGEDPSPYHFQAFDLKKLKALCGAELLIDQVFAESAGGAGHRFAETRLLRDHTDSEPTEADTADAEWWLMTALKDPVGAEDIPYVETVFPAPDPKPNAVAFAGDYVNPWLVHSMVLGGIRVRSPRLLRDLAERTLERYPTSSPDTGAALCVLAYQALNGSIPGGDLQPRIETYLAIAPNTPHQRRWHISLTFVLAQLHMSSGRFDLAKELFQRCAQADFMQFSPHLATKITEAAWWAGRLEVQDGDPGAAWQQAWQALDHLKGASVDELLVNPACPASYEYGDGLREITISFDQAIKCANGIHGLASTPADAGVLRGRPDRNFQNGHAQLVRGNQQRGGEIECLRKLLRDQQTQINTQAQFMNTIREDGFAALLATECGPPSRFAFAAPEQQGVISVIIPLYNGTAFIERTLRSVWEQTLDPARIEIVLADDGSSDGSLELAQRLQQQSPCAMQVLTHSGHVNKGVSATRNLCLHHAHGEYVALLDADDLFLPRRLEASVDYFAAHPECEALCSYGLNVDEKGNPVTGYNGNKQAGNYRDLDPDLAPPFSFDQLWNTYPIANSSISFRRRSLGEAGGYPHIMAHQAEDWLLMLLLSLQSPIACIEEELMHYTHHPDSYTTLYHAHQFDNGARYEVMLHAVNWMAQRPPHRDHAIAMFRKQFPILAASRTTPNASHLPMILKNAWGTFRQIGPLHSGKMLATSVRNALRKKP